MRHRFARLAGATATIAAVAALGVGVAQPQQATAQNAVVQLWDQWTGAGAPWPRQISSDDNDYACLDWLSLGETGANDPSTQANASFFGPGGGTAPNVVAAPGQLYTLTTGQVVAQASGTPAPAGWNGAPPINVTGAQFYGGSTSYQPPTQLFCTSSVQLADPGWSSDDTAQLTGSCVAPNVVNQNANAVPVPYLWSGLANGAGSNTFYTQMASSPSTAQAVQAALSAGLLANAGDAGTWVLLGQVLGGQGLKAIAGEDGALFLLAAINASLGSLFQSQSTWFTSTAWSIESSNQFDASWSVQGPPGTSSTPPSSITVGVFDDWATGGALVAMGFQCSASPSPVGAPLAFADSVMNGETVLSENGYRSVRTRPNGRAVPMTARPRGWVNVPSLYSRTTTKGVTITLRNINNIVSPGNRADTITGGTGRDRIAGGAGDDRLHGGRGNDAIYGGGATRRGGRDVVHGGPGHDLIAVFDRRDTPATADRVSCGPGTDVVQADWNDTVLGDCEFIFRGSRQVRTVRAIYRNSTSKAAALRVLKARY